MEARSRGAWWAVAALVLATLTGGFDITVLNVALPTIGSQLGANTTALQWMVNAYVLVFACLILPMGGAGDRWGRRRVLLGGLALFTAGSVLAAWAGGAAVVIAARAIMGVGMAMVLPMTLATLAVLFPSPPERSRAVAAVVAATGLGVPLGPLVGGWLLERYWWGSVFLINVPIAIVALAAIAVLVPESADPAPPRADFTGAGLAVAGLAGFTYAVIEAPLRGWGAPAVLSTLLAGLGLLAVLVAWERRTDHPLVEGALFRDRSFAGGSGAAALAGVALFALLFVIPMYLQLVRGHPPMGTGLRLLPVVLGLVVGAAAGDRLARWRGHRAPVVLGLLLLSVALAVGARTGVGIVYGPVAAWLTAAGVGIGMALAPATDAVLDALPPHRSGAGTALAMTIRYVGGSLGVAVLGAVLSKGFTDRLDLTGVPTQFTGTAKGSLGGALVVARRTGNPQLAADAAAAFVHGMSLVLIVCSVVCLLGAAAVAAALPAGERGPAQHRSRP